MTPRTKVHFAFLPPSSRVPMPAVLAVDDVALHCPGTWVFRQNHAASAPRIRRFSGLWISGVSTEESYVRVVDCHFQLVSMVVRDLRTWSISVAGGDDRDISVVHQD